MRAATTLVTVMLAFPVSTSSCWAKPAKVEACTEQVFQIGPEGEPGNLQLMGCLLGIYPLRSISFGHARRAVSIEAEPNSLGALFAFKSVKQRDRLVGDWIGRWTPSFAYEHTHTNNQFGRWAIRLWRMPDGSAMHAIFPVDQKSGHLCMVRADLAALRQGLAVLNNWCLNAVGFYRKR